MIYIFDPHFKPQQNGVTIMQVKVKCLFYSLQSSIISYMRVDNIVCACKRLNC